MPLPGSLRPKLANGLLGVCPLMLLLTCSTAEAPDNAAYPITIEIVTPEATLDLSQCSTIICCSNCPDIPVSRIIDGDTFVSANATIRLFGVDTPERGEPCYEEAKHRLWELADESVRVQYGPRREDQYGRILLYIYTFDGESIDEMLVREGLARAWTQDGQYRDVLVSAEQGAQRDGFGCLWHSDQDKDFM
jgi:endonuclease YncB( thermonuclease family)